MHSMHNPHRAIVLSVLLILSLLSFSCTQDMEGIFYSLEKEIKVPDNSLNNDISVTGMIRVGSYYLAAAGSVFYRGIGATEWQKLKSPITDAVVTDIETDGTNVVVAVTNGGSHGLFKLDVTGVPAYTATNIYSTKQVFKLFRPNSVGSVILASVGVTEAEADFFSINAALGTASSTNLTPGQWVRGATWDGTNYLICTSTSIYSNTTPTGVWTSPVGLAPVPGVSPLRDIFADGTTIYLSAKNYLLKSTNGTSWASIVNNSNYDFTTWAKVNGQLLIGTDGSGYRHVDGSLSVSTPPGNFLRIPNLLYASVLAAFTDVPINTVFFGTSVNGLWRGDYTITTDPVWAQE
jgi:hypothetical protein